MAGTSVLYASIGSRIIQYKVDVETGSLNQFAELHLPLMVRYAWANSKRTHLYAACSDIASSPTDAGIDHCLVAMRIDAKTGGLGIVGPQIKGQWPGNCTSMTLDATDRFALSVYNRPPSAFVHRIAADGTLENVPGEQQHIDVGSYPHQVRVSPSNKRVFVVSRGSRAGQAGNKVAKPGALKVAQFSDGRMKMHATIAPNEGVHFGARNLDFHPTRPWVYVVLELENKLHMFGMEKDEFTPQPVFVRETLVNPSFVAPEQMAGAVHVHPNGKTVYVVNRANGTAKMEARPFYAGGDNTMAVYAINQQTGEPTLIQAEDTRGLHARTFSIEPGGQLLVAAHVVATEARNISSIGSHIVPAGLSTFKILDDGKLQFLRRYDVETDRTDKQQQLFWSKLYRIGG